MRRCEYCGKPLSSDAAPRKRFCSAECERRSYYEGRRDKDHAREEAEEGIPLREFQCEYCYAADTKRSAREYSNPRDTWFMKGRAEGAAWALKEIEKRMG